MSSNARIDSTDPATTARQFYQGTGEPWQTAGEQIAAEIELRAKKSPVAQPLTPEWFNEWPTINGFYWLRGWRHHGDLPINVDGDTFWMMFALARYHRTDLDDSEDVQFLGPITPYTTSVQPPTAQAEAQAREIVDKWHQDLILATVEKGSKLGQATRALPGLAERVAQALTTAQSRGAELQREADAKAICFMCAEPEKYQPARDVEGFDRPCHFYTASHPLRPNCNAAECKATAIRALKQPN